MNHGEAGRIPFRSEYLGNDAVVARDVPYLPYGDAVDIDSKALPVFVDLLAIFAGTRQHGHLLLPKQYYNPLYFFAWSIPPPFAVQNSAFNPDFRLSRQARRLMISWHRIFRRSRAGMTLATSPATI